MSIHTDDIGSGAPVSAARRIVSAAPTSPNEEAIERALRPKALDDYVGQIKAREQLEIFIAAAKKRSEALDHVLLFGPPGLGKTTLAHIVAAELGVNLRQTSGPVLEKPKDLAAILTNLEAHDVLFIDEIHRLSPVVEEILYPALEDYQIDIMIGEGPAARSIKLELATVHADRCDHARRHADESAARPLRHRCAARVLHAARTGAHRAPLGRPAQRADRRGRCRRNRAPLARHTTHRQPPLAPRARLCRRQGRGPHRQDRGRRRAGDARRRSARLRRDGPQAARGHRAALRRRPGRAGQLGRSDRRGERHDRRRDRALPDSAGLPAAHAAWPRATLAAYRHLGLAPPKVAKATCSRNGRKPTCSRSGLRSPAGGTSQPSARHGSGPPRRRARPGRLQARKRSASSHRPWPAPGSAASD